jgi:dTDP-glucose 4,6-dehydratase
MFDTVVSGTRWALEFARQREIPRTLFMSSGAVYGQQPWELERVPESWSGGPICTNPLAAYAEGKRAAEMLCAIYAKQFGLDIVTARIFALLGPHIELGIHFAAGNFIRDAMQGRPVIVKGDGRPCRSYLYASDLTAWLLAMLVKARPGAVYNVGSDQSVSIADLARRTSDLLGGDGVTILGAQDPGWNPGRYVPDTSLIRHELGVQQTQSLDEAILKTALWNGWEPKS